MNISVSVATGSAGIRLSAQSFDFLFFQEVNNRQGNPYSLLIYSVSGAL
jgi:hypothetical protein